jgi:hypothetical protein
MSCPVKSQKCWTPVILLKNFEIDHATNQRDVASSDHFEILTPSERLFSDCGLALTAKRSRLKDHVLQEQVMIWRNIQTIQITQEDIEAQFSNKL